MGNIGASYKYPRKSPCEAKLYFFVSTSSIFADLRKILETLLIYHKKLETRNLASGLEFKQIFKSLRQNLNNFSVAKRCKHLTGLVTFFLPTSLNKSLILIRSLQLNSLAPSFPLSCYFYQFWVSGD